MVDWKEIDFMGNLKQLAVEAEIAENVEDWEMIASDIDVEDIVEEGIEEGNATEEGRTFFKMYDDNLHSLMKALNPPEFMLFMAICPIMNFKNIIVVNKTNKKKLMEILSLKNEFTINNVIASLVKKGVMKRVAPKIYYVYDKYATRKPERDVKVVIEK